jgi:ABC-2 type transport system ATP-binding protein
VGTIIKCEDVTRFYGPGASRVTAVDSVSLEIEQGEFFGLLGTNGAGKTSLMETMQGLVQPNFGRVAVMGVDPVKDRKKVRQHIGMVLQSGGLPRELTVAETLTMWRGTCSNPAPVDSVLQQVELGDRAATRVGSLSGGEQRRLDLACALVGRPKILFLDEPTTGLDPEARRSTWSLFERLHSDGVTVLLTTHYLDEAESLCGRIALMHQGHVRLSGTITEIVKAQPSIISFECSPATWSTLPDRLRAKSLLTDARQCTIRTADVQSDLRVLLHWAGENGLDLRSLQAVRPSLDAAYFSLVDQVEQSGAAVQSALASGRTS